MGGPPTPRCLPAKYTEEAHRASDGDPGGRPRLRHRLLALPEPYRLRERTIRIFPNRGSTFHVLGAVLLERYEQCTTDPLPGQAASWQWHEVRAAALTRWEVTMQTP
jgi:hypothetical protein